MSTRFDLTNVLGAMQETRRVVDPWGFGWEFEIARLDCRPYAEWQRQEQALNPLARAMTNVSAQAALAAAAEGQNLGGEDFEATRKQVMLKASETFELDPEQMAESTARAARGVAEHLIRGWAGVLSADGVTVPYTVDAAVELLTDTTSFPATKRHPDTGEDVEIPHGGNTVGQAVLSWVLEEAAKNEAYRAVELRAVEGKSEARSDGTSAPGAN